MRRLTVFFWWLFGSRNNVGALEMFKYLIRPKAKKRASKYIRDIGKEDGFYVISFNSMEDKLYWPMDASIANLNMVICETFDRGDWHYYQKPQTVITDNEILLDIGSAEGLLSLSVVGRCERIILVEPNSGFASALTRSFINYQNKVEIVNAAIGDVECLVNFNEDAINSSIVDDSKTGIQIRQLTVDSIVNEVPVTYIKADIEGYELQMLRGASNTIKRFKPKIAVTSYHTENDAHEIIKLVKSYVPQYRYFYKGVGHVKGKPIMIHFWI